MVMWGVIIQIHSLLLWLLSDCCQSCRRISLSAVAIEVMYLTLGTNRRDEEHNRREDK